MNKRILSAFAFFVGNFLFFQLNLWIFKSSYPFLGWLAAIVQIVLLIIFPYKKILNNEKK